MEVVYIYTKKRSEFGRQCNFTDVAAELLVDIPSNPDLLRTFIHLKHMDEEIQCVPEMAEHEANTETFESKNQGINHSEGGWPKDVNATDAEQTSRFRKKVEKEESYINTISYLGGIMEHLIKQNNALNIYEEYFTYLEVDEAAQEPASAKTVNVYRDPNPVKRAVTHICWHPDGGKKLAMAYGSVEFQGLHNSSTESYIWDVENPNKPELALKPMTALSSIEYNPKDNFLLISGLMNGQIALWDVRKGSSPIDMTPSEISHKDPVFKAVWLQSKTGTEFFSGSTDCYVMWWDTRKLSAPTEILMLDAVRPGQAQDYSKAFGAITLEFEPTIPTKYMVGTEEGTVLACNRKGKTPSEKINVVYPAHEGPVYAVERNPCYNKNFLTVGDYTVRIWAEDCKDACIMWTRHHNAFLTDGCWSPIRPAVYFTCKTDGTVDVWDILFRQSEPALSLQISDDPLLCIRAQEQGRLVTCGSQGGTTTTVLLSDTLVDLQKNEKNLISAIFEREKKREKLLEARQREIRLKEKSKEDKKEESEGHKMAELMEDPADKAEREFKRLLDIEIHKGRQKLKEMQATQEEEDDD